MTYEDVLRQLSEGTQRIIGQLWDAVERGALTPADFDVLARDVLVTATARGYDLGTLSVRAYVEAVTGQPYALPATAPGPASAHRLGRALATIAASGQDSRMQLLRLAGAEPLRAAQRGQSAEIKRNPKVTGWTRGLESDACELCVWWWRNGRVWQAEWTMPDHTGCMCHQVPAIGRGDNVQTERQAAKSRARAQQKERQKA